MPALSFDLLWRDHGAARGLRDLGRAAADSHDKMSKLGVSGGANLGKVEGALKRVGGVGVAGLAAVAGGAIGLGVALGNSVGKAATFDKTMRQVGVQTGQTGGQLEGMTALALEMGKVTSFSAQGASEAMLELAKGGLTAAQMRAGALEQTLTLATAGGLELGDAAGYMTQGLNTFGLKAEDAGRVAAALAGAANASTASVGELGTALGQVGPGAALAGLSIEDTTAALAAFTNNGMKGSDAGTALKTMLNSLTPTTDKAKNALRDMGIVTADGTNQFFTAKGEVKSMTEVAGLLEQGLKGMTTQQKMANLETIFGSDAYRAAAVLAKEGADGIAVYTKATSDSSAAQELAKSATAGYSGALERFQGSVETAQIQLGTKFLPILTTVLDYLSGPGMASIDGIARILQDTFAPQIDAASGGVRKFFEYLSTHQADVIRTFQSWGNGVFDFGVAVSKMVAAGLRQMGDFTAGATSSVFMMVRSILKAFDSIPGVDLSGSVANFNAMETSANQAATKARDDLYGLATGIDKKVIPATEAMRARFNKAANQQILTAKQRDAVAAVGIAIDKLGTQSGKTQIKLRTFKDISKLSADQQRAFKDRLNNVKTGLADQVTAARRAGAGQKELTATWKTGKQRLYEEFIQMGLSKREAGKLAEKYAGVTPKVETKVTQPGMTAAQRKIKELKEKIKELKGKKVNVEIQINTQLNDLNKAIVRKYGGNAFKIAAATGGVMPGFTPGRDVHHFQSPTGGQLSLSGGEAVMRPEWTRAVGGAPAVAAMNRAAMRGQSFAGGGVYRNIDIHSGASGMAPNYAGLMNAATGVSSAAAAAYGKAIAAAAVKAVGQQSSVASAGTIDVSNPRGLTSYRGGTFSNLFAANLRRAEKLASTILSVFQGGYRPTTSYSGTSHAKDAVDFQVNARLTRAVRQVGIAAGDRTGLGNWAGHTHAVPTPGAGFGGGSAVWQAQDYLRRGGPSQSLRSPWGLGSGGVMRRPSLINISESGPERVLSPVQTKSFDRLVRVMDRGGGAVKIEYHIHAPNYVGTREDLRRTIVDIGRGGGLDVITRRTR